jgi:hypothetical protein
MPQHHLIDKVILEIGLNKSRHAFDLQNNCSQLMHHEILAIIEQVCDQFSQPDEHIIIDKIEVNLGKLSAQNFTWEMQQKFKSEFSLKAQKVIEVLPAESASATVDVIETIQTDIDATPGQDIDSNLYHWKIIKYYLHHGSLPWYVKPEQYQGFEKILLKIIEKSHAVKTELKTLLQQPEQLSRLLSQCRESTLNTLYSSLFENNINWVDFFDETNNSIRKLSHSAQLASRQTLWESIWSQSINQLNYDVEPVLTALWKTILRCTPSPPYIIIDRFIQDQSRFYNVSGLQRSNYLRSLDSVKAELLKNIDTTSSEPLTLLQEMDGIRKDNIPDSTEATEQDNKMPRDFDERLADNLALSSPLRKSQPGTDSIETSNDRAPTPKQYTVKPESTESAKPFNLTNAAEPSLHDKLAEFHSRLQTPDSQQQEIVSAIKKSNHPESPVEDQPQLNRYPVDNVGLIIFWPYLQIYFDDLGLLENQKFKDRLAQQKALHLLQYLATGEEHVEEHALTLNKILCNWDIEQTVDRFISLSKQEKNESEKLLNAIIQHWSVLGKTSIQNLRLNFIQRKGLLQRDDSGWLLRVEKGPYDVLMDRIPWSLSMIKLSWMDQLLRVEW